jgi:ribonuclease Y
VLSESCATVLILVILRVADFAAILPTESGLPYGLLGASIVLGLAIGVLLGWLVTRQARRLASCQATQVVEVAKREALVGAQETKQRAEADIQTRRAEFNREFDRREIESEIKLREIRAHEESLVLLDRQLEQKQDRLGRESAAVKQARDAMRQLSKSLRKRLEGVASMDAEEIRKQLREEVHAGVPG